MDSNMKIHFETRLHHSRAMTRIQDAIKKYAPKNIQFTSDLKSADVQFLHMIGTGELKELKKDKFVIFPYCFEHLTPNLIKEAKKYFENAVTVFSYLDIENIIQTDKMNLLRSPLGVDTNLFKKAEQEYRDVMVTTTGYVAGSEGIDSCVIASAMLKRWAIHIGGDLTAELKYNLASKYPEYYHRKEGITDEELVACYNRSNFVSGLRIGEGFEFPVIEGILCGARPICFDIECYRHWFKDLPVYIPESSGHELAIRLLDVFYNIKPVTQQEIDYVKSVFSWEVVASNFWKYFLERI